MQKTMEPTLSRFQELLLEEDQPDDGMTEEQTAAFPEAISIIIEKCRSKQECTDAIRRILAHFSREVH